MQSYVVQIFGIIILSHTAAENCVQIHCHLTAL